MNNLYFHDLRDFNLGDGVSLIVGFDISEWGKTFCIDCKYLLKEGLYYSLVFSDCKSLRWEVNSPDLVDDMEADIINLYLGNPAYKKPALIHTDIFTVEITYENLDVRKKW